MAVSIRPVPPADHLVPPRGLAALLPVHHPHLAPLFPKNGQCSLRQYKNGTHMFYWCNTCLYCCTNLFNTRRKTCPESCLNQFRLPDWPAHLRRKGPPLTDQRTEHFLHPAPGTAAPPLAAYWSSSPSPSPPLPVPTLTYSPAKMQWLRISFSFNIKHIILCGLW